MCIDFCYKIQIFVNISEQLSSERSSMDKWRGKISVVTGASSGIGAQIVKDFTKNGITTIALARRVEKIEEFVRELPDDHAKVHAHNCDVSNLQSVRDAFRWIEEKFHVVHILVNNAGIGR